MRGAEQKEKTSNNRYLLLAFKVITARERSLFVIINCFPMNLKTKMPVMPKYLPGKLSIINHLADFVKLYEPTVFYIFKRHKSKQF